MASVLPPTTAPKDDYAGDEINALVLDPGSHTTRAGFAGEDTPKSVVPTHYGLLSSGARVYGENAIHRPSGGLEIRNPYDSDGLVEDWETASRLWQYSITSRLTVPARSDWRGAKMEAKDVSGDVDMEAQMEATDEAQERPLAEYPLLMSEPGWNPTKARERTMEIAMEEWGVPAFFLAKTGQLAAYANGKATAIVVDVGHYNTSVTAVWEGMVLRKSITKSPLAGAFLNTQLRTMFASLTPPCPLTPHYLIASKHPVDALAPPNFTPATFATPPTPSFRALEEDRILTAFKESVVQCWQGPGRLEHNLDAVKYTPARPFEFPCGFNMAFGLERYKPDDTLPSLLHRALATCDPETRPHLLANIILTGASSLLPHLAERLQADLQTLYPNPRVRVLAATGTVERKFGAWVGGSVLGSLGTFGQMWVSREEYEEFGAGVVGRRCK
ncbi:hypothetical protein LTR08_008309 [Meristemomyces frigidus]|nr:hypothetical protein LTR08_008309 [Meristemomyces frigidus]